MFNICCLLYLHDETCLSPNHFFFRISTTGEKGDEGDKGDPGMKGNPGATGATGPQGESSSSSLLVIISICPLLY